MCAECVLSLVCMWYVLSMFPVCVRYVCDMCMFVVLCMYVRMCAQCALCSNGHICFQLGEEEEQLQNTNSKQAMIVMFVSIQFFKHFRRMD